MSSITFSPGGGALIAPRPWKIYLPPANVIAPLYYDLGELPEDIGAYSELLPYIRTL